MNVVLIAQPPDAALLEITDADTANLATLPKRLALVGIEGAEYLPPIADRPERVALTLEKPYLRQHNLWLSKPNDGRHYNPDAVLAHMKHVLGVK